MVQRFPSSGNILLSKAVQTVRSEYTVKRFNGSGLSKVDSSVDDHRNMRTEGGVISNACYCIYILILIIIFKHIR